MERVVAASSHPLPEEGQGPLTLTATVHKGGVSSAPQERRGVCSDVVNPTNPSLNKDQEVSRTRESEGNGTAWFP